MPFNHSTPFPLPHSTLPTQVLIVDDQPAVRAGLARLISAQFPVRIEVHTAGSLAEALLRLAKSPPHIAILDVDLAGEDGLALISHISHECRVLVFSSQKDCATRDRALQLGAAHFLEKGAPASLLKDLLSSLLPTEMQGEHPPGISGDSSAAERNGTL